MTDSTNVHPVLTVQVGDRSAEIDEMLAPLVEALWINGFDTFTCCQNAGESAADWAEDGPHMVAWVQSHKGWAYIDFPIQDGLSFLTAIAQAGPRDGFYHRMTHWAALDAWEVNVKPMDEALFDSSLPSRFGLRLLQVCFPVYDLDEMHDRVEGFAAGDLVAPL